MKPLFLKHVIAISLFFWLVTLMCSGQKDSVIKISPTLYEITGMGGNIACKVTDDGVILVDAGTTPENGKRIIELVGKITNQPIKYIILTHYHFDHVGGLQAFPGNVCIVAQNNVFEGIKRNENAKLQEINVNRPQKIAQISKDISTLKPKEKKKKLALDSALKAEKDNLDELKNFKTVYPGILFSNEITLFLGSDTIVITRSGPAHTKGDSWVYFKNDNAVHLGDMLFTNACPYIDNGFGANTENWIAVLKKLAAQNYKMYIPGHNAIASPDDVLMLANYLEDLRKAVAAEIALGKTQEEIVKSVKLTKYNDFGFQFLREQNIKAVYKELK